jgi:putative ABC transport system permease protein
MRLALRELRRSTRRFVPTTAALALLVMLLLFLGGLLDGLYLGSTGALRAQDADLVVYSDASRDSVIRSRIDAPLRAEIDSVAGVRATYGLGFALVGARVPGESELADTAVVGYQGAVSGVPAPPPPGQAWADRQLEAFGVEQGDRLLLGPARVPVTVRGFVEDTNFLQQGGLWVEPETWREVLTKSRPGAAVGAGTFQVVTVRTDPGANPETVARRIDAATAGATKTLTTDESVLAIPGIKEQNAVFTQIIGVTLLVAGLVVALFFALLTLERIGIFAVLKAIGASSRQLVAGLFTQALVVSGVAFALGAAVALLLSLAIPPQVPLQLTVSRAVFVAVGVLLMALVGGAISLRRIIKVDPASVIGAGV